MNLVILKMEVTFRKELRHIRFIQEFFYVGYRVFIWDSDLV